MYYEQPSDRVHIIGIHNLKHKISIKYLENLSKKQSYEFIKRRFFYPLFIGLISLVVLLFLLVYLFIEYDIRKY